LGSTGLVRGSVVREFVQHLDRRAQRRADGLAHSTYPLDRLFLLPSVAAAVIGGTSIFGGVGGYTGTILGALILSVLNSMLTFLNVGQAIQQVVYGTIVLALAWGYAGLTRRA